MRILITGIAGQLGHDVLQLAKMQNIDAVGIDRETLDLTDEQAVLAFFKKEQKFDAIIHCAAYTAVDNAEDDQEGAYRVNVKATEYLVKQAQIMDAKIIYISTDYVYSGIGELPFTEQDIPNPLSVYGKTKLAGEEIAKLHPKHFVIRVSWVFGLNGNNFVKTMLKLSESRSELSIVNDQIGSPTYTRDLAKLIMEMTQTTKYGVYQASNEGFCSWYEFAQEIFTLRNKNIQVTPVSSDKFPTKAIRPHNSRMSKQKLVDSGFELLPTWQDALQRYLVELEYEGA